MKDIMDILESGVLMIMALVAIYIVGCTNLINNGFIGGMIFIVSIAVFAIAGKWFIECQYK